MEELLEILKELKPDVDFETEDHLADKGILDSFSIISLVSKLDDEFDIEITPLDVIPANFNSAKAIYALVTRLQEE